MLPTLRRLATEGTFHGSGREYLPAGPAGRGRTAGGHVLVEPPVGAVPERVKAGTVHDDVWRADQHAADRGPDAPRGRARVAEPQADHELVRVRTQTALSAPTAATVSSLPPVAALASAEVSTPPSGDQPPHAPPVRSRIHAAPSVPRAITLSVPLGAIAAVGRLVTTPP